MVALQKASVRTEDDTLLLTLVVEGVGESAGPLQVQLALHDDIAVIWFASFDCNRIGDAWEGRLGLEPAKQPRLLELVRVQVAEGELIEMGDPRLFLEPTGNGAWATAATAEAERQRLEGAREARFGVPVVDPAASESDPTFAVLMLADNLYLTTLQRIPGIRVLPLSQTTLGADVVEVLNDVLQQLGFGDGVPPQRWMEEIQRRRPAAVIHVPRVRAADGRAAHAVCLRMAHHLLDLLALRRGATPRLLGGVVGALDDQGVPRYSGFWIEGSGYTGNLAGGFIAGEDIHGLLLRWDGLSRDPRARLWLSLYADAIADERWDYRLFRCFNLLEGVASELIPRGITVRDDQGSPRLQDNGQCYTTDHARGKVYELLRLVATRMEAAEANFTAQTSNGVDIQLWHEVGVWVAIRNAVAHRGAWELPDGMTPTARHVSMVAEIEARGHDGAFVSGVTSTLRAIQSAVKSTLYAGLLGRV